MAHHNFEISDAMKDLLDLGPTGQFPEGHYGEHDAGEIRFGIAADPDAKKILIDFGVPVKSLGMTAEQSEGLIDMLQRRVWELRGIKS